MILKNEEIGFSIFEYRIPTKEEEEKYLNSFRYKKYYKCKDGNLNISVGYNNYSSSDKKAFNSIHHCFKYYRNQLLRGAPEDFNISKDDCFKADLSQSSRDAGIECGYFEYKLNSKNGLSETFKTCSPFDFDSFVKVGRYEDFTKSSFSRFAEDYGLVAGAASRVEVRILRGYSVKQRFAAKAARRVHGIPEAVEVKPVLRHRIIHRPGRGVVADLEEAHIWIGEDVLRQNVIVSPVRMVDEEHVRRVPLRLRKRVHLILRLAHHFGLRLAAYRLDERRIPVARYHLVEPDAVHVQVAPHAVCAYDVRRNLATRHEEKPSRLVEARGDLRHRAHPHLGLAIPHAPFSVREGGLERIKDRRLHRLRRLR